MYTKKESVKGLKVSGELSLIDTESKDKIMARIFNLMCDLPRTVLSGMNYEPERRNSELMNPYMRDNIINDGLFNNYDSNQWTGVIGIGN